MNIESNPVIPYTNQTTDTDHHHDDDHHGAFTHQNAPS